MSPPSRPISSPFCQRREVEPVRRDSRLGVEKENPAETRLLPSQPQGGHFLSKLISWIGSRWEVPHLPTIEESREHQATHSGRVEGLSGR